MIHRALNRTFCVVRSRSAFSILVSLLLTVFLCSSLPAHCQNSPKTRYVSKSAAAGGDGTSWQRAWNEVGAINWSTLNGGDTVYLDGGTSSMTYTTTLRPKKSGTSNYPIKILQSNEAGHNGTVFLKNPQVGIAVRGYSYITIEGARWKGIVVDNCSVAGVQVDPSGLPEQRAKSNILKFIEIRNCGATGKVGLAFGGDDLVLNNVIVHDNFGKNIVAKIVNTGAYAALTFNRCWIYSRSRPDCMGLAFGTASGITPVVNVNESVIGPGLNQGISIPNNGRVYLRITESLFINATQNNILCQDPYSNVRIERSTSFMTKLNPAGSGHSAININNYSTSVSQSIFYGGAIKVPVGSDLDGQNTQYRTTVNTTALSNRFVDPKFVSNVAVVPNTATIDQLIGLNFALTAGSPATGTGAKVTSVSKLFTP